MKVSIALVSALAVAAAASSARATVLTGPVDTILTDIFEACPVAARVATGLDGGTASATWNTLSATAAVSDALWQVSGGTHTGVGTTSASTRGATVNNNADDANIVNAALPFTPQANFVYDFSPRH